MFHAISAKSFLLCIRQTSAFAFCFVFCGGSFAANGPGSWTENPENFRIELTGSAWLVNSSGTIQANGAPINLISDLGAQQRQPTFYGQLVIKPARKHRIVFEGTPFRINGYNVVNRTVMYRGQTFNVSQTLRSNAELNYAYGGYQYDLLSGRIGHFGLSLGGAYLNAIGTIRAVETGAVATKSETIGIPLAGADLRLFPVPGHKILEIDGGLRGMGLGSYGKYIEANGNGGICFGPLMFLAGYRTVNANIHSTGASASGVDVRLRGPIFSLVWRW